MLEKIVSFEVALFPILSLEYSNIYLENSLVNLYFGFDIEKTIPVYIPTLLVMSFI